jgi:hypothetical protein
MPASKGQIKENDACQDLQDQKQRHKDHKAVFPRFVMKREHAEQRAGGPAEERKEEQHPLRDAVFSAFRAPFIGAVQTENHCIKEEQQNKKCFHKSIITEDGAKENRPRPPGKTAGAKENRPHWLPIGHANMI